MMKWSVLVMMLLGAAAACGSDTPMDAGATPTEPPGAVAVDPVIYRGQAEVLEDGGHGPQLCAGVLDSYPPQCSGPDLIGWDWDVVGEFERAAGTTWGFYEVTGHWDGTSLTLTELPTQPAPLTDAEVQALRPRFETSCEPPPGGWPDAGDDLDQFEQALAYAEAEPEYGAIWVSYPDLDEHFDPSSDHYGAGDPGAMVYNVTFTANLDQHEAELRARWEGPLCVSTAAITHAELVQYRDEITAELDQWTSVSINGAGGTVIVAVYVDEGYQQRFDARYGPGVIEVNPLLQPVAD